MLQTLQKQFNRNASLHKYVIIAYGLLMCMFWFYQKGIISNYEGVKYMAESDRLVQGQHISNISYIFYYATIALLALSKKMGLGVYGYILLQYIMCGAMVYMVYNVVLRYTNTWAAFAASILFISCTQLIEFSSYVYTETPFFTATIFCLYSAIQYLHTKKNKWLYMHILSVIGIVFVRPSGIAILAAYSVYWFIHFIKLRQKATAIALIVCSAISIMGLLYIAANYATLFNFILPFKEGRYICGYPTPQFVPTNLWLPKNETGLSTLFLFILNNPIYFLKSCLFKLAVFYGMWRPEYSITHNIFSVLYFYPVFIFGFIGIYKLRKFNKPLALMLWLPICFTTTITLFTCDDTNNRFILPIVHLFIIAIFVWLFNNHHIKNNTLNNESINSR